MGDDGDGKCHLKMSVDKETCLDIPVDKRISRADHLVCGLESQVFASSEEISSYSYDLKFKTHLKVSTGVQALSWGNNLSEKTVYFGLRNGKVLLWDMRSRGAAQNVIHSTGPITHLSSTRSWGLLVCSLKSLNMYDLRATGQPLVRYSGYNNEYDMGHGFNVDSRLGLVAVANGRSLEGAIVNVYDIESGSVLSKWNDKNLFKEEEPSKKYDKRLWRYASEVKLVDGTLVVGVDNEASQKVIESVGGRLRI